MTMAGMKRRRGVVDDQRPHIDPPPPPQREQIPIWFWLWGALIGFTAIALLIAILVRLLR